MTEQNDLAEAAGAGSAYSLEIAGREAAPLLRLVLVLTSGAAGFIGLLLYGGGVTASGPLDWFAWPVDQVTAVVIGAGFLGAVPMLLFSATRTLWEQLRVPALAGAAVVTGLTVVTVLDIDHTSATSGELTSPAFLLAAAWLIGVSGLTLGFVVTLVLQATEPALPLPRTAPLPRPVLPLVALEGTALLGLGFALLVEPSFWVPLLPWQAEVLDGRMLGAWALALGLALLGALAEDDLARLRGGLLGVGGIGLLALAGLAATRSEVAWQGWSGGLAVVLLGGLAATGVVGLLLERRSRS